MTKEELTKKPENPARIFSIQRTLGKVKSGPVIAQVPSVCPDQGSLWTDTFCRGYLLPGPKTTAQPFSFGGDFSGYRDWGLHTYS